MRRFKRCSFGDLSEVEMKTNKRASKKSVVTDFLEALFSFSFIKLHKKIVLSSKM